MLGEPGSCCRGAKLLGEHKGRGCQKRKQMPRGHKGSESGTAAEGKKKKSPRRGATRELLHRIGYCLLEKVQANMHLEKKVMA